MRSAILSPFHYSRRRTRVVMVGPVAVGGDNPIRIQSMTTTPTMDTEATVAQTLRLTEAGCEIVRITAPTINEAQNLETIKNELLRRGCNVPLVADIHFRPDAALVAADFVEKVRINPGNFTDGKAFKVREYTDEEYQAELNKIEDRFTPLVLKLKKLKKALRIGTNHGSLSDRIMNRFGDTPLGMVESALEFMRICRKNDFHDVIFSMKASNPKVMIAAYRLLAERLAEEGMDYPFHLGVTEAGDGEDGRIKSAVGIGSLLEDGIGDTIRVSLTEDPELEIPPAREIAERYKNFSSPHPPSPNDGYGGASPFPHLSAGASAKAEGEGSIKTGPIDIGPDFPIRVVSKIDLTQTSAKDVLALLESRLKKDTPPEILEIPHSGVGFLEAYNAFRTELKGETNRLGFWISLTAGNLPSVLNIETDGFVYRISDNVREDELKILANSVKEKNRTLVVLSHSNDSLLNAVSNLSGTNLNLIVGLETRSTSETTVHAVRWLAARLNQLGIQTPILLTWPEEKPSIETAIVMGSLICDGIGQLISVANGPLSDENLNFSYNFLQASGNRITKTEYVSCPSCGRTLFDLQSTTERIKSKTGHLKGVKIAIMGCIVNGPGEMADAHFGYVGGGPGKINLYVGKTCVQKGIPTEVADEKLVELIKSHGKWVAPPL